MNKFEGLPESVLPITALKVDPLNMEQLDTFTSLESIHATPVMELDPAQALERLESKELQEKPVIAVDIGGDTAVSDLIWLSGDRLLYDGELRRQRKSLAGLGYLAMLEVVAQHAKDSHLPVGISYAGPLDGTKPTDGANVEAFLDQLDEHYDGDFANLFPTLATVRNDAVAGLVSGAIQAKRDVPETTNVIFFINGSGIGGAVLARKGNQIFAAEPGHVAVVPALNPENEQSPCGLFGNEYTCIENVAGTKAGIGRIWSRTTGEELSGREIEDRYMEGNEFAAHLYNDSAVLAAHTVQGLANVFGFDLASNATAVVAHGGGFKFPYYEQRIKQVLGSSLGKEPRLLKTNDYSPNACLDGAAILALLQAPR